MEPKSDPRFLLNVVRIDIPSRLPTQRLNSSRGRIIDALWFGADERVLAVGFVPNGNHRDALGGQLSECSKLCRSLMGKPVAHAE